MKPQLEKARAQFCRWEEYRKVFKKSEDDLQLKMTEELNQMHYLHKNKLEELDRSNEGKTEEEK